MPKVPVVSKLPELLLTWEQKKLFIGLLGPESVTRFDSVNPNRTLSPLISASPSIELKSNLPLIGPVIGVAKPDTVKSVYGFILIDTGVSPTKRVRFLDNNALSAYTTHNVHPAQLVAKVDACNGSINPGTPLQV